MPRKKKVTEPEVDQTDTEPQTEMVVELTPQQQKRADFAVHCAEVQKRAEEWNEAHGKPNNPMGVTLAIGGQVHHLTREAYDNLPPFALNRNHAQRRADKKRVFGEDGKEIIETKRQKMIRLAKERRTNATA